jgi:iron complex transport system ATP-binding protein
MRWVTDYKKTVLCITHDLHNLSGMQGYILNLSATQPQLEPINPEVIQRNIAWLEAGRKQNS